MAEEKTSGFVKLLTAGIIVGGLYLAFRQEAGEDEKRMARAKKFREEHPELYGDDEDYGPLGPPRGVNGVSKKSGFNSLRFEFMRSALPTSYGGTLLSVDKGDTHIGELVVTKCDDAGYAAVDSGWVEERWRGRGLYPKMLTSMRDYLKEKGCRGVVSRGIGRRGVKSTKSWEKFAAREPRVRAAPTEVGTTDYYLDGLPARGRIPMKTVKAALKKLPKSRQACNGMTAAALREGMEVEREHRDITRGAVGQTAKIAAAHICERPDYYRRIKRFVEK